MEKFGNSSIEIFRGKTLNIKNNLEEFQKKYLIKMLEKHSFSYAWECTHMKGMILILVYIIFTLKKILNQSDNFREE